MEPTEKRTNQTKQSRGCLSYLLVSAITVAITLLILYFGSSLLINQTVPSSQTNQTIDTPPTDASNVQLVLGEAQINEILQSLVSSMPTGSLDIWTEEGQIRGTTNVNYNGRDVQANFIADLTVSDNQTFMLDFTSIQLGRLPIPLDLAFPIMAEQLTLPDGLTYMMEETAININLNQVLQTPTGIELFADSADLANNNVSVDVYYEGDLTELFQ